ncbi:MAG: hypothetical protein NTX40_11165 [Planctomycetota bacterium]|nr:hypothetical protein [Planctomycetota bacterium]
MLENLKVEVCRANRELPRRGLVAWTSGNVIARGQESGGGFEKIFDLRF